MYPLYFVDPNKTVIIKEIRGNDKMKKQCLAQGLCPGTEVMVSRMQDENLIVRVKSSYYVVGKALASFIFVEMKTVVE